MADRNAERPQLVGQFPVLVQRQADVLGGFDDLSTVDWKGLWVTRSAA